MRNRFPVTVHILFLDEENVLMLRRFNTGYEDGNFSLVAGHLDGDETIAQAAIREIKEEVGVVVRSENLEIVGVMHRMSDEERVDFFLAVRVWEGKLYNREPEKCDKLAWYPFFKLPANTIPYIRRALEKYKTDQEHIWFDEFGW
ncbi:MAG: NUDIX domain-containing protein [Anaerolineales bacterium]|nr:NUDIX domain-containing protein [Anaerolineales bacterium]MCK5430218.1 NUDIX domain-containing protein [Anaerolineales bacterium]